jgi:hypothetical protein
MALFEISGSQLKKVNPTTFSKEKVQERRDLQAMLRDNIGVILPNAMVLAEEYGDWDDSRRRVDLLCLGKDGRLLVVELKRTEDGGHMDLQAIRYAAMISGMTFADAVACYSRFKGVDELASEKALLSFLDWDVLQEEAFAKEIEIVLVASEFSKEITSTVLWLSAYDLRFLCIRLRPYRHEGKLLVDVETIFPLPEAEDYQVKIRRKQREERTRRSQERDFTRYDLVCGDTKFKNLPKRELVLRVAQAAFAKGHKPFDIIQGGSRWIGVEGCLDEKAFLEAAEEHRLEGSSGSEVERFFTQDDQLFKMSDQTFALTKMWGWGGPTATRVNEMIQRFGLTEVSFSPSSESE